jgi:8-oxo-dGTP pyrophosphatase MutT (NUDIX family)
MNLKKMSNETQSKTSILYKSKFLEVRKTSFSTSPVSEEEYICVQKPDTSMIIGKRKNLFYLVEEFRYPSQAYISQFPLETKEENETFLECAKRGFEEELNLRARKWTHIAGFMVDPGISKQRCEVFLAEDIEIINEDARNKYNEGLNVRAVNSDEIEKLFSSGTAECWSIAAWHLYKKLRK